MKPCVSVVIPAYNEQDTISQIIEDIKFFLKWPCEILVIDDGSSDNTVEKAEKAGAKVISHQRNKGYLEALQTGFKCVSSEIVVMMDADGQHDPRDIHVLVEPIIMGRADVVIGIRKQLTFSEKVITQLTRLKVQVKDACSGFKALRAQFARNMNIKGQCGCGTFILEAKKLGARIEEVNVNIAPRHYGESKMNSKHVVQLLIVIRELLF